MTKYVSTRNKKSALYAHEAIIRGLSEDGGLYTPLAMDIHIDPAELLDLTYQQQASRIIGAFFDDYTPAEIEQCTKGAYDEKFDTEEIVPLRKFDGGWLMDLWHGPTSAFKDIALTILPRLLSTAYQKENRDDTIAILTATSGDTGKAALSGFADVPNTAITVFYPEIGVSEIQKLQMQTSTGKNVDVIAVRGNFDDCQRMVKEAVSSPLVLSACRHVTISSANSINIGRLIPQTVYYFHAYTELVKQGVIQCGETVSFAVPTGNFGDILAGYLAYAAGLPISRLITASNSNNVLTDFIRTGTYDARRPFHTTMSPSMDILISSNLERLLFLLSEGDDAYTASLMKQLQEEGSYTISDELRQKIQQRFAAYWTDEEDCASEIRRMYEENGILIDPHTAVAVHAMREYQNESGDESPCVVLSTASPYKFSAAVLEALGEDLTGSDEGNMKRVREITGAPVPAGLAGIFDKPVVHNDVIDIADMKTYVIEKCAE